MPKKKKAEKPGWTEWFVEIQFKTPVLGNQMAEEEGGPQRFLRMPHPVLGQTVAALPARCFKASIIEAAERIETARGTRGYREKIRRVLQIKEDLVPFNTEPHAVITRPVLRQSGRRKQTALAQYEVCNPGVTQASFHILVLEDAIPEDELRYLLETAGEFCGVGAAHTLGFGRFIILSLKR